MFHYRNANFHLDLDKMVLCTAFYDIFFTVQQSAFEVEFLFTNCIKSHYANFDVINQSFCCHKIQFHLTFCTYTGTICWKRSSSLPLCFV